MKLQESGEMYLETILILSQQKGTVRSVDVSEYMNYSKPSVSRAMGLLRNGGFIRVDKNGYITLTEDGKYVANRTYERHKILSQLFISLGVDEEIATEDACRIEHCISDETFSAIKKMIAEKNQG